MIKKLIGALVLYGAVYGGSNLLGFETGTFSTINSVDAPISKSASTAKSELKGTAAPVTVAAADPDAPRPIKDNVIAYKVGDAGMEAARKKAFAQLPTFHKMWDTKVQGTYTVKFPLTQNGATEHIWMQVFDIKGDQYIGMLSNTPENGTDYKMGDKIVITMKQLEDWMVQTEDGWFGGYTARYMLKDAPEAERAKLEAMFRD